MLAAANIFLQDNAVTAALESGVRHRIPFHPLPIHSSFYLVYLLPEFRCCNGGWSLIGRSYSRCVGSPTQRKKYAISLFLVFEEPISDIGVLQ
jgi:hypothetical protein